MLEKDCLLIKELEIIVVLLPFFTVYTHHYDDEYLINYAAILGVLARKT